MSTAAIILVLYGVAALIGAVIATIVIGEDEPDAISAASLGAALGLFWPFSLLICLLAGIKALVDP